MYQQIITFYRVCDAYLQQKQFQDDPQARMTTTEVLVTALVAAYFFASNLRHACALMHESGLVVSMLSESRFNRRWHKITPEAWQALLDFLEERLPSDTYIVDSCPFPVCHNRRADRCRLYVDEQKAYWGYCAAKEEYYYGLKAHVIANKQGRPVEVLLLCGCSSDLTGLKEMRLALPSGSALYGDKIYTDYDYEDELRQTKQIHLLPIRKSVHKRQHEAKIAKQISYIRKRIETTFSQITAKLPRRLRAVTPSGFESKAMAAFVAFAIGGLTDKEVQTCNG